MKKPLIKRRELPKICYVCGKEVLPDIKLKRIATGDGKFVTKTITIPPLMIGKDENGKPLYRHQEGKCEPGTSFYLKKVKNIDPQFKTLFENGIEKKANKKVSINIDEDSYDADWPKHNKRLRRRK